MGVYERALTNFKNSMQPKQLGHTILNAAIGSLTYWGTPTLGQRLFNTDLTGAKGATLGVLTGAATAFATGRSEILAANLGSFFTHMSYVYNDKTVDILGGYNWRLGHGITLPTPGTMNDGETGQTITLPDGQTATAYNPLNVTAASLPPTTTVSLPSSPVSDYLTETGAQATLNDYMDGVGNVVNDYMDASGNVVNDYMDGAGNIVNDYMNNNGDVLHDGNNPFGENFGGY